MLLFTIFLILRFGLTVTIRESSTLTIRADSLEPAVLFMSDGHVIRSIWSARIVFRDEKPLVTLKNWHFQHEKAKIISMTTILFHYWTIILLFLRSKRNNQLIPIMLLKKQLKLKLHKIFFISILNRFPDIFRTFSSSRAPKKPMDIDWPRPGL